FTLGNLLDIWGISLTPANFGPLQGTVGIYATPQTYWLCPSGPCYRPSNQYQAVDPSQWTSYQLYLHSVVWIVIGAQPDQPSSLPNIEWITGGGN
ncbi:MAG TPA: hypothetical protein VFL13_03395, partial [Candidatus Baltobacteraceae bacterium]|nr:hypothetical protein [Candidatus Baltobacteraceae bacterium]